MRGEGRAHLDVDQCRSIEFLRRAPYRAIDIIDRHRGCGRQLHLTPGCLLLHLDSLAPCFALVGVDLAQVQHLALRHTRIGKSPVHHNVQIFVELGILATSCATQKNTRTLWTTLEWLKNQSLHYQRFEE